MGPMLGMPVRRGAVIVDRSEDAMNALWERAKGGKIA